MHIPTGITPILMATAALSHLNVVSSWRLVTYSDTACNSVPNGDVRGDANVGCTTTPSTTIGGFEGYELGNCQIAVFDGLASCNGDDPLDVAAPGSNEGECNGAYIGRYYSVSFC